MAPSLSSLRLSRPDRSRSLERVELDSRWGDQSITAPTYQKPGGTPIVPTEWASPATTLVDSSPDLSLEKSVSPVESRNRHERDTLTITIPLPWKRKSRNRSASPLESSTVTRVPVEDPHENFVSPVKDNIASDTQQNVGHNDRPMDSATSCNQNSAPPQSARLVNLKSPVFPVSPVWRESQRLTRNVDFLTSELDNLAMGRKARAREDSELTPVDALSPDLDLPAQKSRPGSFIQSRSPVPMSTPMVGHFMPTDVEPRPTSASASHHRPPPMSVNIRPGQQVTVSVLTPVQERHERTGQTSPNATSIEASPSSPTVPALNSNSLSRIASTPVDTTQEQRLSQQSQTSDPSAALTSHPTSEAPGASSSPRPGTRRHQSRERTGPHYDNRVRATSQGPEPIEHQRRPAVRATSREPRSDAPRRSSSRRAPSAPSVAPRGHAYRRSSDLTSRRRPPSSVSVVNTQKAIQAAYFARRSRSMEPTPSSRIAIDPIRSPTDSLSSGSTDVEPVSDDESVFSQKDPDRYFEARQHWNGVAGEGRKGFYANVVDDYRMIGRDVSHMPEAEIKMKPVVVEKPKPATILKKIGSVGGEGRVKIAGLDAEVAVGGQTLVPTAEELWG